jgi:hypothetical protein
METVVNKYFKTIKICKTPDNSCLETAKIFRGSDTYDRFDTNYTLVIVLSDGTKLSFSNNGCSATANPASTNLKNICSSVNVDLNGSKPPNTFGRDIFQLKNVSQRGDIYPDTSIEWSKAMAGESWASYDSYWRNNKGQCGEAGKTINADTLGSNCLARIIENSWQIDYF